MADDFNMAPCLMQEIIREFLFGCMQTIADGDELILEGVGSLLAKKELQKSVLKTKEGRVFTRYARVRVRFHRSTILGKELRKRMLTEKERGF